MEWLLLNSQTEPCGNLTSVAAWIDQIPSELTKPNVYYKNQRYNISFPFHTCLHDGYKESLKI